MIGTELVKGQGLGNQLFVYVTARAIAKERGCVFGTAGRETLVHNIHDDSGMYFMDLDLGEEITPEIKKQMTVFEDEDTRLYIGTSAHDLQHGAYISGPKESIHEVSDNTLLCGNLQDESYFSRYRDEIGDWLKVKPAYDIHDFTADDLCVIHLRCGDYMADPGLFLERRYWLNGVKYMRSINPAMRFHVITDEPENARKILPEFPAVCNDIGTDYAILKNARYLLLSNSSFAVFPALTSTELKLAVAPKYWARHNVSDGYWASEQNIYSFLHYMDRQGRVFTPEECRRELENYKRTSGLYARRDIRPTGAALAAEQLKSRVSYGKYFAMRAFRSAGRRLGLYRRTSGG
ncbi:MAG: glycosyl transferase [Lachnospiraceae bacterium]|nr:glycosyl transferase [Lachnospiraceae bacterium]